MIAERIRYLVDDENAVDLSESYRLLRERIISLRN